MGHDWGMGRGLRGALNPKYLNLIRLGLGWGLADSHRGFLSQKVNTA